MDADQLLFTYSTLQHADVQLDTFGRLLEAEADVLPGYTIEDADVPDSRIEDAAVKRTQPMLRATGNRLDKVVGQAARVTETELDACDEFQASLCRRVAVVLASGRPAWTYVAN